MSTFQYGSKDFTVKDGWILWRTKGATVTTNDTDHVSAGSSPTAAEILQFGRKMAGWSHGQPAPNRLAVMVIWIGASDEIIHPDTTDHSTNTRGIFDLTLIEVMTLQDETPTDDVVCVDSLPLSPCKCNTPYVFDMAQGQYWPRLSTITAPTGGASAVTKAQIWCKPFAE